MNRCLLLALTVLAALLVGPTPTAQAAAVRLDGVTVYVPAGGSQVVTVNRTSGTHARVTLYQKSNGKWQRKIRASGRIGYGGLVRGSQRKQGTGKTPLGTYRLLSSFGMHYRKTAWDLSYKRIRSGDYWVGDNRSRYYNRYRSKNQGGFRWRLPASNYNASERLVDYRKQYEYSIVTSFNYSKPVRNRGFGIFLHVNGRGATAGCVSAPRWFLSSLMGRLDPDRKPVIAIGR